MCRPSCCDNSGGQGAGIAAVALIAIGTLIVAKIGPIVARIVHVVLEVIRIAALTTAAVLAVAIVAWLAAMTVRWWLRHRDAQWQATSQPVNATVRQNAPVGDQPECLACGGSGKVLQLIDGSRYQPGVCPVCEPAQWAG
jgi:hypothetical protein